MPPQPIKKGEKGRVAGESHPAARYTDHEIELMRSMHEQRDENGNVMYGYRKLAKIFECTRGYVRKVCKHLRRP